MFGAGYGFVFGAGYIISIVIKPRVQSAQG